MNWQDIKDDLNAPLAQSAVKAAPQGKFGEYVDAYHVISEANRIFGHGGWSYTVTRLEKVSEQTVDLPNKGPQYRVGYMATVRVSVGDVVREGAAVGSGMGNPNNMADHHEAAVKEAETDAMKRGLRTLGNTFGLALYDKQKANVAEAGPDPAKVAGFKNGILRDINSAPDAARLAHIENHPKFKDDMVKLRAMDGDAAVEVETRIEELKQQFQQKAA